MKNRFWILVAITVVSFVAALVGIFRHKISLHPIDSPFVQGYIGMQNPINVKMLTVLSGNEFDMSLADQRRIHAVLEVQASSDAKKHVLDFLNRSTNPRVVLKHQNGNVWVVQLFVTTKDAAGQAVEIDVAKWLRDKKLAYD